MRLRIADHPHWDANEAVATGLGWLGPAEVTDERVRNSICRQRRTSTWHSLWSSWSYSLRGKASTMHYYVWTNAALVCFAECIINITPTVNLEEYWNDDISLLLTISNSNMVLPRAWECLVLLFDSWKRHMKDDKHQLVTEKVFALIRQQLIVNNTQLGLAYGILSLPE